MKKTSRVMSIILLAFMLMQAVPCMAAGEANENIECPNAVKVCYDLGIIPDVYEKADEIVTYDGFAEIYDSFTGDECPVSKKKDNVTLLQVYDAFCHYANLQYGYDALNGAYRAGYAYNVPLDYESNITYSQLAKVIYNVLNGEMVEINRWNGYQPDLSTAEWVSGGIIFKQGYVQYIGTINVSGDKATVSGKIYTRENPSGEKVSDVTLSISDKDLKDNGDYVMFVKDDTIISAIPKEAAKKEKITKDITPPTVITLKIGDVNATVNGENIVNDVAPMVVNDRTMLPIRFVAEALGAQVGWQENTQKVLIKARKADISIVIGQKYASVAEYKNIEHKTTENVELDSPAFVENDRTYLPLRFIAEKLGAEVGWDEATQTVTITKK